jgi:NitT/TauT family transport system permease protein
MPGVQDGIGAYLREAGSLDGLARLFAGVRPSSIRGVGADALIARTERRLPAWRG